MGCPHCHPGGQWYCDVCADYGARQGLTLPRQPGHGPLPSGALPQDATEATMQGRLRTLAHACHYLYYHTYSSKRSDPGWVDTVIVRPDDDGNGNVLYLWELKTTDGAVSPAQQRWIDALAQVVRIETAVYRPSDWPIILEKLRRKGV